MVTATLRIEKRSKIWDNLGMTEANVVRETNAISSNQSKHETKNPLRQFFLENFNSTLKKAIIEDFIIGEVSEETQATPTSLGSVLEVGCGEGFVLEYMTRHITITRIFGADISERAVEKAKTRLPQAEIFTADLSSDEFLTQIKALDQPNFDLTLCLEVLEHIKDYQKALQNLKSIPTENFVISVPNEPFFRLSNFIALKNIKDFGNDPEHINNWSVTQFKRLLEEHFVIRNSYYPFPWQMYLCKKRN